MWWHATGSPFCVYIYGGVSWFGMTSRMRNVRGWIACPAVITSTPYTRRVAATANQQQSGGRRRLSFRLFFEARFISRGWRFGDITSSHFSGPLSHTSSEGECAAVRAHLDQLGQVHIGRVLISFFTGCFDSVVDPIASLDWFNETKTTLGPVLKARPRNTAENFQNQARINRAERT